MNILENITFSTEKPNVVYIRKSDKVKYICISLGKDAVLKKHRAPNPATLLVLEGEIRFLIDGRELHFKRLDTYEIPVNVEHEVIGVTDKNLFTVVHELVAPKES
ncbi:cupin domain-containing protein [Kaistella palustris]|uniref:cupin domain-containing protein n=1 Tax=Kaistella palustris TaxID=493376 RepID=UPI0004039D92|nr:cupin domain-containing protein [Kaistella palustris]